MTHDVPNPIRDRPTPLLLHITRNQVTRRWCYAVSVPIYAGWRYPRRTVMGEVADSFPMALGKGLIAMQSHVPIVPK